MGWYNPDVKPFPLSSEGHAAVQKRHDEVVEEMDEAVAALTEKAVALRDAGRWVLNIINNVSRSGGYVEPLGGEPEAAFEALKTAIGD